MDGFALRSEDQKIPRELLSTVYAGTAEVPMIGVGQAVAVMTGGTVPPGADTVVPVECTEVHEGALFVQEMPLAGRHIRQAGEIGMEGKEILSPEKSAHQSGQSNGRPRQIGTPSLGFPTFRIHGQGSESNAPQGVFR
jgi:molybdopterin biosynthesis enzyme